MQQTRLAAFVESLTNVSVGYLLAILTQLTVFPMFGIDIEIQQNLMIAAIFVVVSLTRSYVLRRLFDWYLTRA